MMAKLESLDKKFEHRYLDLYNTHFNPDGIINPEVFYSSNLKILWVLKESNSPNDECWDMKKTLADLKTEYGIKKGWEKTFGPIIYVSQGLLYDKKWDELPSINNQPEIVDTLNEIAFINV